MINSFPGAEAAPTAPARPAGLRIQRADPDQDLEALVQRFRQRAFFADRLSRQKCDVGVLLIAWRDDT